MSTLWTLGCSFTAEYTTNLLENVDAGPYHLFRTYRGGLFPKTWATLLSERLNLRLENLGFPGADNYTIFQQFTDNCSKMNEGDVVIVGWSFVSRFRLSHPTNNHFTPFTFATNDLQNFWSQQTLNELFVNRLERPWVDEIYSLMNVMDELSKSKKFKIFYWSADNKIINGENESFRNNNKFILPECNEGMLKYLMKHYGALNISYETNHTIPDEHFGQKGHEVMADMFYNDLIKKI